ncbi:ribosome maturation factor RimM [Sinomonas sp. P10A9]|uniref:Ribosome maturation factor RimM n=1 Tax=Sinomonas puerhi TaxID=3238584 RepID=A0AB39KYQ0_9MICC
MHVQVARLGKPHGIRGEVTAQVFTDAPEDRFVPGVEFTVEPDAHGPLTLLGARWNKDILLLSFAEVSDRNRAEELRGAMLFVDTEELEDDDEGWYEHELVGLTVRVDGEDVGTVAALRTLPVQDLLVIETPQGEVLVPFVEEIVPEVDPEGGFIVVVPPPGLFELNREAPDAAPEGEPARQPNGEA